MTLDLRRIFAADSAVLPVSYEMDMSNVDHAGAFPLKKPVKTEGSVSNRADTVRLSLKITYCYEAPCARCGETVEREYKVSIEKALAVAVENEDNDTVIPVPDMKLDVDELIFTEVYGSLPSKLLCKDSCRGLCPMCGKNLNEGDCGCSKREIDPRFAALADLLDK